MVKSRFLGPVWVSLTGDKKAGRPVWETLAPIYYDDGEGVMTHIPRGSKTNFADIPWIFTWLIPTVEKKTVRPVILHDVWLSDRQGRSRARIDGAFRHALISEGNPRWKCWVMWAAVRLYAVLSGDK